MLHLLFQKLATEPDLFAEHASAYAALAALEACEAGRLLQHRALAWLACGSLALLALALSCTAALLAAALPWHDMPAPWVLVGLPAALWVASGAWGWIGSRQLRSRPFEHLRQQWAQDAQLVRDVVQST